MVREFVGAHIDGSGVIGWSLVDLDDREPTMVIGTISLRHELNDYLRREGGHIGYGVRPTASGRDGRARARPGGVS